MWKMCIFPVMSHNNNFKYKIMFYNYFITSDKNKNMENTNFD